MSDAAAGPARPLLAVPNVSEGSDPAVIDELARAFGTGVALLDIHSDEDHDRSVLTLTGPDNALAAALAAGARTALSAIDLSRHEGLHPHIGALDVCPIVHLSPEERGRARDSALVVAREIAELGIPVFLYGDLASAPERRERAFFRRGGPPELERRMTQGELEPDLGPPLPHPSAGATLVTARPPLAAFNLELEDATLVTAREIAAELREAGGGPHGVRAIALELASGRTQISTNVHDPVAVPLGDVVRRVDALAAERGASVVAGEIVGLVPAAALANLPPELPLPGFERERGVIEERLRALG